MRGAAATQQFVPIKEIKEGVVFLTNGQMAGVLMTSSLNFALKSYDEQQSILYQFQNFLNSLDFPVQICVHSTRLDIKPYLNLLEEQRKIQTNDLMKIQVHEYIQFIRTFTEDNQIMTKSFFVVVPFVPPVLGGGNNPVKKMFGKNKEYKNEKNEVFDEYRIQLEQRVAVVEQGLKRCGVDAVWLGTDELVELYYRYFNPGDVERPMTQ